MRTTRIRIDVATHLELKRLAAELHTTVGNAVTLAVRALSLDRMGVELAEGLREDEVAWLDAELVKRAAAAQRTEHMFFETVPR